MSTLGTAAASWLALTRAKMAELAGRNLTGTCDAIVTGPQRPI